VDEFNRSEDDDVISIDLKMNVAFKNAHSANIFTPVLSQIDSIYEDDHYLNIITGRVTDHNFLKLILKISKKKFLRSEEMLNRRMTKEEMAITPYGDHQSLITIDLEFILDYLAAGDKLKVEVETRMDMGNRYILSKKYIELKDLIQYKKETIKL